MAKKTLIDLKNEAIEAFDEFLSAVAVAVETGEVAFTAPSKAEKGSYSRDELEEMDVKSLRDLAKRHGLDTIKKAEIIDALASDEDEDEEDEIEDEEIEDDEDEEDDEEADEEEEEEEDEDYTRDDLAEMSLAELRTLAKESGYTAADYKGMDQDALIDMLLGEEDEEEDEEDEEDEEEAEDVEEGEEEELTEDDLNAMSLADLKEVAGDIGVEVPRNVKKPALVALILESAEE